MRTVFFLLLIHAGLCVAAQEQCGSAGYLSTQKSFNTATAENIATADKFLQHHSASLSASAREATNEVIKIPVVVHVLYKEAWQNLSDEQIKSQLLALNRDFRKKNGDTVNTPERFRSIAADVQIEFYLAAADPKGRATTGIVRKQTATANWLNNDRIKASSSGGDDAWDSRSYLNIWVGNLVAGSGYSSAPGSDGSKDGVVINTAAFGTIGRSGNTALGRIAVHEVGHWLGLKHIWGDAQCGDDGVTDTPQQSGYTLNCPSGFRSSCDNGLQGDMYMNYMDYTADACMNLFTEGQKRRMRAAFDPGGPRESLLWSKGLRAPLPDESPLPEMSITTMIYPNPATLELNINLASMGGIKTIVIYNAAGTLVQSVPVTSTVIKLALSSYKPGMYFVKGEGLSQKFIKL